MKIFMTGGTGYLGGRLAQALRESGHEVRLLVRDPARRAEFETRGFETVVGTMLKPERLNEALEGREAVVHCAALVRNWVPNPEAFEQINVAGTWALADAALRRGVRRFVYTSSFFALGPSPDGRPLDESALAQAAPERFFNDYHSTKFRAARLVRDFLDRGLDLVTLFPTVVYGPGAETDGNHVTRILRMLQQGRFPGLIGGGGQRWNLAFVEDVVRGHLLALEMGEPGGAWILGGHDVALRDLAVEAARRLGVRPPNRSLPFGLCRVIARVEELKARLLAVQPELTRGEVEIYRHDWVYSSDRAVRELGYRITPLEAALGVTLDWVRRSA
jgi:farnesol dehydrogenase